jgi:hypothetical protein
MARELAREKYGLEVEMCLVADDCAVPRTKGITGAQGRGGGGGVRGRLCARRFAITGGGEVGGDRRRARAGHRRRRRRRVNLTPGQQA